MNGLSFVSHNWRHRLNGTNILAKDLTGRGYPGINTLIAGCTMIITVIGDVLLIPKHGIMGAAVASSIGYSASLVLTLTAFRGRSGIRLGLLPRPSMSPIMSDRKN